MSLIHFVPGFHETVSKLYYKKGKCVLNVKTYMTHVVREICNTGPNKNNVVIELMETT